MIPGGNGMVCLGVVTGAHGIRGQLRVRSFTAVPEDIAAYGPLFDASGNHPLRLTVVGRSRDRLIVHAEGIGDRNQAEALGHRRLYVPRAALPEAEDDTFYHVDLIGLSAELGGGEDTVLLGTVTAVHDFGAGDLLEITRKDGRTVVIPFTVDAVPVVDVAAGRIVVAPVAGLLDDDAVSGPGPEPAPVGGTGR